MFIATILASLTLGVAHFDDKPLKCAVMGSPTKPTSMAIEYAGSTFPMCCGGCPSAFMKEPKKFIDEAAKSEGSIGMFLFDPVSGAKLDVEKVKLTTDYKGLRYGFTSDDDLKAFKADSAKFIEVPKKESMVCPVSGEKVEAYSLAGGFVDYKGVRYYSCCEDCMGAMKKDMAAVLEKGHIQVAEPKAFAAPKKK